MCTVAFLYRTHPFANLIVAMNRDEFRARETAPVHVWDTSAGGPLVAGKDLVSGGAWFAIGPRVFVALTNDRSRGSSGPSVRSRGELVVQAAKQPSASDARALIQSWNAREFGPCHLVIADDKQMFSLTNADADLPTFQENLVPAGAHVLGNFGLHAPRDPVVEALRPKLASLTDNPNDDVHAALHTLMREDGPPGPCVDFGPYGTMSSATLSLLGTQALFAVDEPPNRLAYDDRSELLRSVWRLG